MISILISLAWSFILVATCLLIATGTRYLWNWYRNMGPARRSTGIAYSIFGPIVKIKREGRGISLKVAAKEIGIAASTLFRIEKGLTVQVETLERVAAWIGDICHIGEEDILVGWRDAALRFAKEISISTSTGPVPPELTSDRGLTVRDSRGNKVLSVPPGSTLKIDDGGSHTEGGGKLADEEPNLVVYSVDELIAGLESFGIL